MEVLCSLVAALEALCRATLAARAAAQAIATPSEWDCVATAAPSLQLLRLNAGWGVPQARRLAALCHCWL